MLKATVYEVGIEAQRRASPLRIEAKLKISGSCCQLDACVVTLFSLHIKKSEHQGQTRQNKCRFREIVASVVGHN